MVVDDRGVGVGVQRVVWPEVWSVGCERDDTGSEFFRGSRLNVTEVIERLSLLFSQKRPESAKNDHTAHQDRRLG